MSEEGPFTSAMVGTLVIETSELTEPAKTSKMVFCETCGYSMNSEAQATAHYSGKSHQRRLRLFKYGTQRVLPSAPYTPRKTMPSKWTKTGHAPQWGTASQPQNPRFGLLPTNNVRFTSDNVLSYRSFDQTAPSIGYSSFSSYHQVSSFSSNSLQQPAGSFHRSLGLYGSYGQAADPNVQTNLNPVDKAVMDNFLGILPTKRRKVVNCDLCGMTFNSDSQANAHFQGTKHQRKAKMVSEGDGAAKEETKDTKPPSVAPLSATLLWCDICRVSVNSQKQLDAHYQGQNHKNKLSSVGGGTAEDQPSMEAPGHKNGWFYCSTCNISVPTTAALNQHIHSVDHISKKTNSNRV